MGNNIYNICFSLYICSQLICSMKKFELKGVININKVKASITPKESNQAFEEWIKSILYTRRGLQYLIMKYPNLSVQEAIEEFKAQAALAEQSC